jgi:hypothetical protein
MLDEEIILTEAGLTTTWQEQIATLPLPDELKSKLVDNANGWLRKHLAADPDAAPLATESGADLLAAVIPPAKWAIPDLLPEGITMLGGKPKVGKSWLVLQIALSICSGGKFFGRDVERGKVLYLALEDNKRRLQSRMFSQGWRPQDATNFDYMLNEQFKAEIGNLDEDGAGKLAAQIIFKDYRLVIIDTFGRAFVHSRKLKDQNAYHQISLAMDEIQKAAMENSAAVMFVDHHTKGNSQEKITPDAVADIQGSIGKGGMSDCSWGIYKTRTRKDALLQIDGRDIEETVSLSVRFDRQTTAWQSEGDYYQKKLSDRKQGLIEWLENEGPMKAGEIAKLAEMKLPNAMTYLNSLIQDGYVRKDENKIYHLNERE